LMNLGGAVPGVGTMALYGQGKYTNAVFAEDEDASPWKSLSLERGFPKGSNVVTVVPVSGAANIQLTLTDPPADTAVLQGLHRMATLISAPSAQLASLVQEPDHSAGILLLPSVRAREIEKDGYSKEKLRAFLSENTKMSWAMVLKAGKRNAAKEVRIKMPEGQPVPLAPVTIVVAGGAQGGHACWMQVGKKSHVASNEIKLPAKWKELLHQAEAALGPIPER
jgi:hypothetical protein